MAGHCRGHQRGRSVARGRVPQHQGQHRKRAAARSKPGRLGLVTGEVAFAEKTALRIIAAMYSTAGMFVVRGDSPARSIDDLKGRPGRVWRGGVGAGNPRALCARAWARHGAAISRRSIWSAPEMGRPMVIDGGRGAVGPAGIGWPGFTNLTEKGGRLIGPNTGRDSANPGPSMRS